MSGDQAKDSNFDIVGVGGRQNSYVDIEGYSLLPDIIWTPGPEMLNSQYGKVIFTNVKECYPTNEDLLCTYTIMAGVEVRESDRVAIFCVGWANVDQVITWVLAAKHPWPNEELSVVFPASHLPPPGNHFYQFCYLSAGEVRGASVPFNFIQLPEKKALYVQNNALIGTPAQLNIVSTGGDSIQAIAAGHTQNLAIPSTEYRNNFTHPGPSSDEPLRANTAESDTTSSSEVTSSEQYAPNTQSMPPRNMSSIPLNSVNTDHDMTAVASTSQPRYNEEELINAQIQALSPEIRRRFYEMERDRQVLLGTVSSMNEENTRLKARLACELDRNRIMLETLRRNEVVINRHADQDDLNHNNTTVVITELENELDIQKMRICELKEIINEKEKTIAFYSKRYGAVNEHVIALGGLPLFTMPPGQPGNSDGQFEQQGHVDIGANSDMQRQCVRTSTRLPPFLAALRKTRNYYVTFLSDKGDIQQKIFALSCTKLKLIKKLYSMKFEKENILRLEYQYYSALENMFQRQSDEITRTLEALLKSAKEKRALDYEAFLETDMIEEIKNRLEINRKNIHTVRAKAIEVFNNFIKTYNSSLEHNSGAAQPQAQGVIQPLELTVNQAQNTMNQMNQMNVMTVMNPSLTPDQARAEAELIQTLYTGLDKKFQNLLVVIDKCVKNTYVWN